MMLQTGLLLNDAFLAHRTGGAHPETPERLTAIRSGLAEAGLTAECMELPIREATEEDILAVHTKAYLDRLQEACASGAAFIDTPDSPLCTESFGVARLAAGSVLAAVDEVMAGTIKNAFCAVRPPGHHCEQSESMGFCLLANVAIAARYLLNQHGLNRIAILDWDVHHGNGTQHLFENTSDVLFCSIHGHPDHVYPGTGFATERGKGDGRGATVNVPLQPGCGDSDYQRAFEETILPAMEDFKPEFVLISAGFDAHRRDPLAPMNLESDSFQWMTERVLEVARDFSGGRLVSVLEGGYDLDALSESVCHHVESMKTFGSDD